jgi:hypothetical protein
VIFVFFENDSENYECLQTEIQGLGALPSNVHVECFQDDYESNLWQIVRDLQNRGQRLAPSFVFVDPYSFKLSMNLLNTLLQFPKCELFVNLMYRYVDMAMHNPPQADNMDALFGTPDWRPLVSIADPTTRAEETIAFFSSQLEAEHVTHMHMHGRNNALKYVLLHAANHPRGRQLMKEAMWSVVPDGTFSAFERHNPDQLVMIDPEPDLGPLRDRLWTHFGGHQADMRRLYGWLDGDLYLKKHLHQILREYRKAGIVKFNGASKHVPFGKNPTISFPVSQFQEN